MKTIIKSTVLVIAGLCWLAVAVVIGLFVFQYIGAGAGLQVFGFFGFEVSSVSILIGLAHVVGFIAAAGLCFIIGVGLCVHGLVPAPESKREIIMQPKERFAFIRHFIVPAQRPDDIDAALRCVRCRVALAAPVHFCPECGWTQPYERAA